MNMKEIMQKKEKAPKFDEDDKVDTPSERMKVKESTLFYHMLHPHHSSL